MSSVETSPSPPFIWRCGARLLPLGERTLIMGILNVTPDSFSDGGQFLDPQKAVKRAGEMVLEGADILDVGGESTRPGSDPVAADEEARRVIPVIEAIAKEHHCVISIDTTKASVAKAAIAAGAHIVNDVSGLTADPEMLGVVSSTGAGAVIMHMHGLPRTMQADPVYEDVVREVADFMEQARASAIAAGCMPETLCLDPGIGFGKTLEHNLALLRNLRQLAPAGVPLLVGASRKRFIGALTGGETPDRLAGSLGAAAGAIMNGAHILRVHDVKDSCDLALVVDKLRYVQPDTYAV